MPDRPVNSCDGLARLKPVEPAHRTLHSRIVASLRDAISDGSLPPGTKLLTKDLADQLDVSRMPVREALHTLEAEGLVKFYPQRGAVVSELTIEEIQEVFVIRALLEPAAARYALAGRSDELIELLRDLLEAMDASENDPSRWIELDREFHLTMYRASKYMKLQEIIQRLRATIDRYVRIYILAPSNIPKSKVRHRQILDAFESGDSKDLERSVRLHLLETERLFEKELRHRLEPDSVAANS